MNVWVVGECFGAATQLPDVMTVGELYDRLTSGPPRALRVRAGLGVDATAWEGLRAVAGDEVEFGDPPPRTVFRHRVVKRAQDNVLISEPVVTGGIAAAELVVPNDSELIRDHTAERHHVPGMLLIEASIQLLTWLVDETVPPTADGTRRYAVMHACRFDFHRFVFPFPVRLRAWLEPAGPATAERIPLTGRAEVEQAGRGCAECAFDLHAFDPRHIFEIEHTQALKTKEFS
ncbi:hypothetical protein GCM10022419_089680 [Nonomuraea rosea]|uniref:A-factor biosynthesis hotdog domain-containing protein n=1 Tax=Nonomuraea rosea TaxID=638574 RepID=A0ABP6Z0V5_9ACTN